MHTAAYRFVEAVLTDHPLAAGATVLEIGAYDVNGSVRPLFLDGTYTGIDVRPGPGVDIVADCADYDGHDAYDLVISTEVMEHMADPAALVACAWRSLRPGGRVVLTMAGPFRPPHSVNGGQIDAGEHYANITPEQLPALLIGYQDVQIIHNAVAHDLYATATKPEAL